MPVTAQMAKLFTRGASKFLQKQREEITGAAPVLQHSRELPPWEEGQSLYNVGPEEYIKNIEQELIQSKQSMSDELGVDPTTPIETLTDLMEQRNKQKEYQELVASPVTDEIRSLEDLSKLREGQLSETQRRKLYARPFAHGVTTRVNAGELTPLQEREPYLSYRHTIDTQMKEVDDISNEITDKYSLKKILETSQKDKREFSKNYPHLRTRLIQDMFNFLSPIGLGRRFPSKHWEPYKSKSTERVQAYPSKEEIIFDSNKVTLLSNEILVERTVLDDLSERFGDFQGRPGEIDYITSDKNFTNLKNIIDSPPDLKDNYRSYHKINVNDFVNLAKEYKQSTIRKSGRDPLSIAAHTMEQTPSDDYLKRIVQAEDIPEEWWRLSSIERGFDRGKSYELEQEGTSLSSDTLVSFRDFAKRDLNRMFYVDLPKNIKPEDIVNLKPMDYIIPEGQPGLIFKPNVYSEKELFVTAEGGFREALKPRRLTQKEKKELLQFNKAYQDIDVALADFGSTQESMMRGEIINDSFGRQITSVFPPGFHKFIHSDAYGDKITYDKALEKIDTMLEGLGTPVDKINQKRLTQLTRLMSKSANELRKLQANPAISSNKIHNLRRYLSPPRGTRGSNIIHDMFATERAKEYLVDLKGFVSYLRDNKQFPTSRVDTNNLITKYFEDTYGKSKDTYDAVGKFMENFGWVSKRNSLRMDDPENFNYKDHIEILEKIDNPLLTKFFMLDDALQINKKSLDRFEDLSSQIREKRDDIRRAAERRDYSGANPDTEIYQLKKGSDRQLTKLWSDYNKSSAVALEFILKNFGYAMGGVVDMRNGGVVGAAVAASLMASGGQASLSDFETPEQITEMQRKIKQNREMALGLGFKNFSDYHKADYEKRLGKARDINAAYWKKYGPMGNFQSKQMQGGGTRTEFILPPGYNLSDETVGEQNKLIKNAYALRNQKIKDENKAAGFTPLTQKYFDTLAAEEEGEYERTGERTGYVNLAQLERDWEKQDAQIAQDSFVPFAKDPVVDMRNGGVVGMVRGGPIIDYVMPEEKEFDPEASKQMDALLAKRYDEKKQAAVDYGGFEQPSPMPDAVPPVPKMNPQHARSWTSRSIMSGLIGEVEGETWKPDTKGILTSPFGINTRDHAKLLEELRIQKNVPKIKDIPKESLKEAALDIFSRMGNEYAVGNRGITPTEWRTLSGEGQFVVTSATFNTGNPYPNLTRALIKYESNPTLANLSAAVKQTWRGGGKNAQKGADNRAVKDLIAGGFIDLSKPEHIKILKKHLKRYSLKSR